MAERSLELRLLERTGGSADFVEQVLARVADGENQDGWSRPVDEILQEAQEEAADICGWALGAAPKLTETQRHRLLVAMTLGATAWRELEELRERIVAEDLARAGPGSAAPGQARPRDS